MSLSLPPLTAFQAGAETYFSNFRGGIHLFWYRGCICTLCPTACAHLCLCLKMIMQNLVLYTIPYWYFFNKTIFYFHLFVKVNVLDKNMLLITLDLKKNSCSNKFVDVFVSVSLIRQNMNDFILSSYFFYSECLI